MKQSYLQYGVWAVALALIISFAPVARAQDTVVTSENISESSTVEATVVSASTDTSTAVTSVETASSEGTAVSVPTKAPSAFGLWWRGIRERVSIALTSDPVKKAEKELQFAEERIQIAQKIAESTDDPRAEEKAQAVINRANEFIERIQTKKDELLKNNDNERVTKLLNNVVSHTERRQEVLNSIAQLIPADKQAAFEEIKKRVENNGEQFLKVLENDRIPEAVKEHLEQVKQRIESTRELNQAFLEKRREILESSSSTPEEVKDELRALQEERKTELEKVREEFKKSLPVRPDSVSGTKRGEGELRQDRMEVRTDIKNIRSGEVSSSTVKDLRGDLRDLRQDRREVRIERRDGVRVMKPVDQVGSGDETDANNVIEASQ